MYYDNRTGLEPLYEFTIMPLNARNIQTCNSYIIALVGTTLNLLLIIVLRAEKNSTLKAYSNVLTLNCICDMYFTFAWLITDVQYETDQRGITLVVGGVFNFLPRKYHFFAVWLGCNSMYISMFIIPILFYTRYLLIVHKKELSLRKLLGIALIPIFMAITLISTAVVAMYQTDAYQYRYSCEDLLSNPLWTAYGRTIDDCVYIDSRMSFAHVYTNVYIVYASATYGSLIFFNYSIYKHMSQLSRGIVVTKYQRQLSILMIMQLILPLCCMTIPQLVLMFTLFARIRLNGGSIFMILFVEWIPLINPLLAFLFISNYRRRAARIFIRALTCGKAQALARAIATGAVESENTAPTATTF